LCPAKSFANTRDESTAIRKEMGLADVPAAFDGGSRQKKKMKEEKEEEDVEEEDGVEGK
jgi:hypothetical protein